MKKHPFRFILFLLMCVSIPFTATAQIVNIPDDNLRAKIEERLDKASGDTITTMEMEELLTDLYAPNANISNLTGLEHATNLTLLSLWDNNISDISAVADLTNLTELSLGGNSVTDISPIAGLTNLRLLHLPSNPVTDISPVAGLVNLTYLNLNGVNISDISLVAGFTKLTELYLGGNNIMDLSPIAGLTNLTRLDLGRNSVSDISALAGLTNLTWLYLGTNLISDISALAGLTNLTYLDLREQSVSDISALAGLTNLTELDLGANSITDISALAGLTNLTRLSLVINSVSDISALERLTNLRWLYLYNNNISDILPLVNNEGLGNGDEVYLNDNPLSSVSIEPYIPDLQDPERGVLVEFDDLEEMELIPDDNLRAAIAAYLGKTPEDAITPDDMLWLNLLFAQNISNLTGLELAVNLSVLVVFGGDIEDVSPLEDLTDLRTLHFYSTNISDLSPLRGLTDLETLSVSGSPIEDISLLAGFTNLRELWLIENDISDLSPLAGLTNLRTLYLNNNNISDLSPLRGLTNLRFLSLHNNSISFLSPLVENTGLGVGDTIELWDNPLNEASIRTHIPALRERGVDVDLRTPTTLVKRSGTVTAENNLLIVEVWDKRARTVEGVPVTFTVTSGGGTLSVTNVATDDRGRAESQLTLGPNTGTNTVEATVEGISESVIFSDVPEPAVRIPDRNLRAAVEEALDKTRVDTITASDMATLRYLRAPNANIGNLTGLELATNLTELHLGGEHVDGVLINSNSVSDLSPLADLTKLRDLGLPSNNISDLSPLAELTNLVSLSLNDNAISDISPLAGLTSLGTLRLSGNAISDISALAGLTNLTALTVEDANITDISVVAGFTNLEWLNLDDNAITDISVVVGLTELRWLRLSGNAISDISALAGLINLESLNLDHNNIMDLSPLIKNMGLEGDEDNVNVDGNPLSDLSIEAYILALRNRGVRVHFVHALSKDARYGHQAGVDSVAFSPDGTMLASGSQDGTVRLWDVTTGTRREIAILDHPSGTHVRSVAFSPDGTKLASASRSDDGTIYLWDVSTAQIIHRLTGHTAGVEVVVFSPDGRTLFSGGHDNTMQRWDIATGRSIHTFPLPSSVWTVAFSPDGSTVAIGMGDGTIVIVEVGTSQDPYILTGHTAWVESVVFSPDGTMLASGSGDSTVWLWDPLTGDSIDTLTGHTAGINSVAFSPDGRTLASASDDSTVILWDAVTGEPIDTLTGHTDWVRSVAFSPDGSTLASGSGDRTVRLWKTPSTISEYTLSIPAGLNLTHVPLKVTAIDDVEQTIESVGDLYDALGGVDKVNFLMTYDTSTQGSLPYFGVVDRGTASDKALTDQMGIIASIKTEISVRLTGKPLGTNGTSTISLNQGRNIVGLPLRDTRINRVSDLLSLDGIRGNVTGGVLVTVNGDFEFVGRVGDPGDIPITGGQGFMLNALQATTVTLSGEGWSNDSATAAPLMARTGLPVRNTTPVLALRGSIIDESTGVNRSGLRVAVKNLSTGRTVAATPSDDGAEYRLAVVDIETMRAAQVGDTLEISAQSFNPFIGVRPLRHTVTAEDVKRSLIQLPDLIAYEIPTETELLANYPNPFNPETWIPYRLAEDADVKLTIYDTNGQLVRTLDIGHRVAAVYESRSKAIYWDGRNNVGESVASGVYFYHLKAGDYSQTRKMLILK